MFSGIVADVGQVISLVHQKDSALMRVKAEMFGKEDLLTLGDSISNSGVCLTVVDFSNTEKTADFDVSSETLRCTTLGKVSGSVEQGSELNLERALRASDRLDGHLVQGHVDCVAEVLEVELETSTYRVRISLPDEISKFVAPKGAICIDGVSLTVGEVGADYFQVYIIPHTWRVTAFRNFEAGRKVNLEVDCIARYVARMIECRESK
ncbi:UNVERIFIED_CONTAM: hypothetical protein GTU68_004707 [Idotea baltica]|nr:hypothetical protein [Idotea baltica]